MNSLEQRVRGPTKWLVLESITSKMTPSEVLATAGAAVVVGGVLVGVAHLPSLVHDIVGWATRPNRDAGFATAHGSGVPLAGNATANIRRFAAQRAANLDRRIAAEASSESGTFTQYVLNPIGTTIANTTTSIGSVAQKLLDWTEIGQELSSNNEAHLALVAGGGENDELECDENDEAEWYLGNNRDDPDRQLGTTQTYLLDNPEQEPLNPDLIGQLPVNPDGWDFKRFNNNPHLIELARRDKESLTSRQRKTNYARASSFTAQMATLVKLQFGTLEPTESNRLLIRRFLREHSHRFALLRPTQVEERVEAIITLSLIPSKRELNLRKLIQPSGGIVTRLSRWLGYYPEADRVDELARLRKSA